MSVELELAKMNLARDMASKARWSPVVVALLAGGLRLGFGVFDYDAWWKGAIAVVAAFLIISCAQAIWQRGGD